jgi:dihydroorotate dehydrogenase (fumarate)
LRWIGLFSQRLRCDIAATTGVQNAEGMIKLLLAGADAVQAASIFYKNGINYGATMIKELKEWMEKQNFKTIDEFKAKLNFKNIENPSIYFRTQFMKYMAGME